MTRPSFAALILITGVGPLGLDTYLPALPAMQRSLGTSATVVQLTVTAYIVGLALGQLLAGPISDGTGRRRPLLISTAAFTVLSLAGALSPNGPVLVASRVLHGMVAGAGVAVGAAVVGDTYHGEDAAKRFGTLASTNFVGPVIAPALGGVILALGSWRTVFALLAVLGLVMFASVVLRVPETLEPAARQGSGFASTRHRVLTLLRHRPYARHVLISCLSTAGFFTYIGGSSFVLQTVYGISQTAYATVFAVNAAAMVSMSVAFGLLVTRLGSPRLRLAGLAMTAAGSSGLLVVALFDAGPIGIPWALLALVAAGMGLSVPASTTLAQRDGAHSRGTAAALNGGLAFLVGACITPVTGLISATSLLPMAALMCGFGVAALGAAISGGVVHLARSG